MINLDGSLGHPKPVQIPMINEDPLEHSATSSQHGSLAGKDDQYDAFCIRETVEPAVETLPDPSAERLHALEKKVNSIEANTIFVSTSMNMQLVFNLVIPAKIKTPDFEKIQRRDLSKKLFGDVF